MGASGGGGGTTYPGGAGGGAIELNITGTLTVNNGGTLRANGVSPSGSNNSHTPGGGAGGSIWVIATTLAGSGLITANGGNGYTWDATHGGGGGGGGRIWFNVANDNFEGTIKADSGTGYLPGGTGSEGGLANKIYRSVGAKSGNLNIGLVTMTISSTTPNTATFTSGLLANIGAGDAIVFTKPTGGTYLAFINARVSSTTFSVASWDGDVPATTTSAAAAPTIYRPFQTLSGWSQQSGANINSNLSSFQSWVLTGRDLVASNTAMFVACFNDAVDTTGLTVAGWTTDLTHYVKIYTPYKLTQAGVSQRHSGKWDAFGYQLSVTNSDGIDITDKNVRLEGLQIKLNVSDNNNHYGIYFNTSGTSDLRAAYNVIVGAINGSGQIVGINAAPTDQTTLMYSNTIYDINNSSGYGIWAGNGTMASSTAGIWNNTVYNCHTGIAATSTALLVSNITASSTDGYSALTGSFYSSSDYNISDLSSDAPNNTWSPGNSAITLSFANQSTRDLHLARTDTIAVPSSLGSGLSRNSIQNIYNYDIDGNTRTNWDIGADEMTRLLYRSIGPGSTGAIISSGGNQLTISGSTSTFSSVLPTNIGVGDALVYNSNTSIAFITARQSATQFTVKNYYSNAPDGTTSDTSWSIYRAYTSLANAVSCTMNTGIPAGVRTFDNCTDGLDMVTYNETHNYTLYADATDTTPVDISGWNTGPQNQIYIYAPKLTTEVGTSQRHTGRPQTGYRLAPTSGSSALNIGSDYVTVTGLEIDNSNNATAGASAISANSNVQKQLVFQNNIIHANSGASTYGINDNSYGNHFYYNNIIYNVATGIYANVSTTTPANANYVLSLQQYPG